jgi:hypothetical protein
MAIALSNKLFKLVQLDEASNWQCYAEPKYVYARSFQEAVRVAMKFSPESKLDFVIKGNQAVPVNQDSWALVQLQREDDHKGLPEFVDITPDLTAKIKHDALSFAAEDADLQKEMLPAYLMDYTGIDLISGNKQEFIEDISKTINPVHDKHMIVLEDDDMSEGFSPAPGGF